MTAQYRGLTWDHPRGYNALAAAAETLDGLAIDWHRHPLEGFESHSIADQCARFDLVVIDHPHVGEAVTDEALVPIEDLFDAEEIAAWQAGTAGPSFVSYRYADRHWALPLDAATQVMAYQPGKVATPPTDWDGVIALADSAAVSLSLAGPHAALSFQSICGALGFEPASPRDDFVDRGIAREAFGIMARLTGEATRRFAAHNPIAMLEAMAAGDGPALCPLIYGYVNYAAAGSVAYANAPMGTGGRIGSTLGGTGIGVSRRATVTPELLDHLRWLMSDAVQRGFIPQHDGQPSLRAAWQDEAVNAAANGFYRATRDTVEQALLRPRHDGAILFQTDASKLLREALLAGADADATLDAIEAAYRHHHPAGTET